uniref:Uncharacterized protein n=1 Tax=Arundo donax TaxID=35708 RepID=A0A0A9EPG5_ARUDO
MGIWKIGKHMKLSRRYFAGCVTLFTNATKLIVWE